METNRDNKDQRTLETKVPIYKTNKIISNCVEVLPMSKFVKSGEDNKK